DEDSRRRAIGDPIDAGGGFQRGGVRLVGVQPPQLLRELVAELTTWQRDDAVRHAGAAEGGVAVAAYQGDLFAVGEPHRHRLDLVPARLSGRLDPEPRLQPAAQQGRAWVRRRGRDGDAGDRGGERVQRRGELRPPGGNAGPGEVGVAGRVVLGTLAQRGDRVGAL